LATSYRFDQRACGRSSGEGPFNVAQFVADLDALRAHFGHEGWIVAGHSWGALLGLLYALAHPVRSAGLIYVSGVGINPSWRSDYVNNRKRRLGAELLAQIDRLRSLAAESGAIEDEQAFCELQWSCDYIDREAGRKLAREMFIDGVRVNNTVSSQLWEDVQSIATADDLILRVCQLEVPTLVLHGDRDIRPYWPAEELSCLLPNARFVLIENAAHFPWVEEPGEVRNELHRFVAGLS
jgi:proline iminopeptidase